MRRALVVLGLASMTCGLAFAQPGAQPPAQPPNAIDYSMFFLADVRDSPECEITLGENGRIDYGPDITNPAMSCPDAFAWSTFIDAVSHRFWEDWSTDDQTWPTDPWPRCSGGASSSCCDRLEISNRARPLHCPVFPGPTEGVPDHRPHEPTKAHQVSLAEAAEGDADGDGLGEWQDVPAVLKTAVIGNEQVELIYRNRPMVEYIFDHELYSTEGLERVYDRFSHAVATYSPFHPVRGAAGGDLGAPPPIVAIDLPTRAIMVKANWLDVELAPQLGIDVESNAPYIVMDFAPEEGKPKRPFLLLSFHMSTKDLPNWFWATFEHVDNQGRCDWTGCNDSFGFLADGPRSKLPPPASGLAPPAANYTPPHQADDVDGSGVQAFHLAREYREVNRISQPLERLFTHFGIGTGGSNDSGRPAPADSAWRSYRLKGSQTEFVTATGRATLLGNSVTEAGFTNSASCISCHARAAVDSSGLPPLAIFADTLSDAGLPKSVNGIPNEAWFDVNAYFGVEGRSEAPGILSIQTDFVWGFRNACPMSRRPLGPSRCANVGGPEE